MANVHPLVRAIAVSTRRWAEAKRVDLNFHCEHLGGMCAIVSAELWRRLANRFGTGCATLAMATDRDGHEGHVFVLFGKNKDTIIDLTATQFGRNYGPVEVHLRQKNNPWFWIPRDIFQTDEELHSHQTITWVNSDQWCNTHLTEKSHGRSS
jgi:hypothetical protein